MNWTCTWPNGPVSQTRLQSSAATQSCCSAGLGLESALPLHLISSSWIHRRLSARRLSRQATRRVCRPRPHDAEHCVPKPTNIDPVIPRLQLLRFDYSTIYDCMLTFLAVFEWSLNRRTRRVKPIRMKSGKEGLLFVH